MDTQLQIETSAITLQMAASRSEMLRQIVAEILTPGIDYGTVPGVAEPFLKKSGAQKLITHFQLRAEPELKASHEDWDKGIFFYRYRVTIFDRDGKPVGACEAGCTNQEDKFKFRWLDAADPGKEVTARMVREKIGRWKKNGDNWDWQERQEIGNAYDQINNVIRRSQKRAQSGAVENVFAAAGFFASEGAKAKTPSKPKEKPDTEFWLIARRDKIGSDITRPLAQAATTGEITWKQAVERLPKPETTNSKE